MNAMQINADDALQHKLDVIYSCFMVQTMKLFAQLLNIQQSLLIPAYNIEVFSGFWNTTQSGLKLAILYILAV